MVDGVVDDVCEVFEDYVGGSGAVEGCEGSVVMVPPGPGVAGVQAEMMGIRAVVTSSSATRRVWEERFLVTISLVVCPGLQGLVYSRRRWSPRDQDVSLMAGSDGAGQEG